MYQLFSAAVIAWSLSTSALAADDSHDIVVLSNRADLISGGDALVQINLPPSVDPTRGVKVALNGTLINDMFAVRPDGRYQGLVTGLNNGDNLLTVRTPQGGAKITITNHPIGGPVFSGAQVQPWICATPTPVAESGNTPASNASGLTTVAFDSQCNIATEYKLFYRTTTPGCSTALPDPSPPAAPPTNNCFKPYTLWQHASRSRDDHHDDRAHGALCRARRTRHAEPRHLRHRRVVRPDAAVDAAGAAGAMERQGGLHLRRVDRSAAASIPHRAELG